MKEFFKEYKWFFIGIISFLLLVVVFVKYSFYDSFTYKFNNNVYYVGSIIEDADSGTFTILSNTFAKDENNVYFLYYSVFIIEGADSLTFEVLDDYSYYAKV